MKPAYLFAVTVALFIFAISPVSAFSAPRVSPHIAPHIAPHVVEEVHVSEPVEVVHPSVARITEPVDEHVSSPSSVHLSTPASVTESRPVFVWYYPWTWFYHHDESNDVVNMTNTT